MTTHSFRQTLIALAGVLVAAPVYAGHDDYDRQTIRARVVSSVPVVERVNEPRRECWTETVGYDTRRVESGSSGGAVLGAIAGGLLGSTVGKGNGRVAAAAVGAATGAVVGGNLGRGERYESQPRQVERCRVHDDYREVTVGYDVRYRFEGREYATRLPYKPGKWVNLDVSHRVSDAQHTDDWHARRGDWD